MATARLFENPAEAPRERRKYPRIRAAIQVELRREMNDSPLRVVTADISLGGCYVETMLPLETGAALNMVLWMDGEKLVTQGVVVTRHPQFGNGIKFVGMPSTDQQRLARFLAKLQAAEPQKRVGLI